MFALPKAKKKRFDRKKNKINMFYTRVDKFMQIIYMNNGIFQQGLWKLALIYIRD